MNRLTSLVCTLLALAAAAPLAPAQPLLPTKVEIAWNRYYRAEEINQAMRDIAAAYPDLVTIEHIGDSLEGRELLVAVVNPSGTDDHLKPAMWIDGNVHGNEVQAAEVVLYTLWYLTRAYGHNDRLTTLMDDYAFYLMPCVNPDGREAWFEEANTPHSNRGNRRPEDSDRDGLIDEDAPDDLDGDGHITSMWREDPNGRWIRSQIDPRVFERVPADKTGNWTFLGSEGIDNDGDGRINEDGPGGDDMNRNWPADWQPEYVQGGAGPFPVSAPEVHAIVDFISARPNIAAVQSYHNTGGMILRGPGASYRANEYHSLDRRVYDEIADIGEDILPYYRSMVIADDLYTVHGGFVNWTAELLGIISFTNEMMTTAKYFQRDVDRPSDDQTWLWRDRIAFGELFTDYTEYDHPKYGRILIGGPNKWSSRSTPTFLLEEECHRNFAFTMLHADAMPLLHLDRTEVKRLADDTWSVTFEIRNSKLIPTRTMRARMKRIGPPDLLTVAGDDVTTITSGRLDDWFDDDMSPVRHEPGRILVEEGIWGRSGSIFRFILHAPEGATATFEYAAIKGRNLQFDIELRDDAD